MIATEGHCMALETDPEIAQRFWIWGAMLAASVMFALPLAVLLGQGRWIGRDPLASTLSIAALCVNAIGWTLTLLPPVWYRQFMARRRGTPREAGEA